MHTCTYVHTHKYPHTHACMYACIQTCKHTSVHMYTSISMHSQQLSASVLTTIHIHLHTEYTRACTHMRLCNHHCCSQYKHMLAHTQSLANVYVFAHAHTCNIIVRVWSLRHVLEPQHFHREVYRFDGAHAGHQDCRIACITHHNFTALVMVSHTPPSTL